jgi:hypothetical protein
LHGERTKAEVAFKDFSDYYKMHEREFDRSLKSKIMETAKAISNAFAGQNKQESAYLKRLNDLMQ